MTRAGRWLSERGVTEHRLFLAAIVIKGIDGLLELAAGITVAALGTARIKYILWLWTSNELAEEPGNTVAHHVAHMAEHLSTHKTVFVVLYLILHGTLKLGLLGGMIRRILWSYPLAALFLVGFMGYQLYRLAQHLSLVLVALTCLDGAIVLLILLEYARLRRSARG